MEDNPVPDSLDLNDTPENASLLLLSHEPTDTGLFSSESESPTPQVLKTTKKAKKTSPETKVDALLKETIRVNIGTPQSSSNVATAGRRINELEAENEILKQEYRDCGSGWRKWKFVISRIN